ncbi:MAG: DUF3472 domain-containing protein [Gammaproteobacteria bacterium]|nr:MAG: DUF3472 domain-containing protein [Gammaproteobacteria bacterium]
MKFSKFIKNFLVRKFIPILLLFSCYQAYAVMVGGIVSYDHLWPDHKLFSNVTFISQINDDGGLNSHYYWANQFYFYPGETGYIGLQNRGKGEKAYNFSIWGANDWIPPQNNEHYYCRPFSHEGKGIQCDIKISWKTGHLYQLDISKSKDVVTGVITDLMFGTKTVVGRIKISKQWGNIYSTSSFVEEFSQGNDELASCYVIGSESSIFYNPIGEGSITAKQRGTSYGNCNNQYIAHTACTLNQCINSISNLNGNKPPFERRI